MQFVNYIIFKFNRMFQYTSPYPASAINYAFLPPVAYQICYLSQEQLYLLPTHCFQTHFDLSASNITENQNKITQNELVVPQPQPQPLPDFLEQKQSPNQREEDFNLQKISQENRGEAKQKFGRNICSNIFHLMVKYIKKQKKMKAVVSRIIQQNNMSIRVNEFYQIFKNRSYKLKAYANCAKITEFWRGPQFAESEINLKNQKEVECSKIFRIVSKLYLNYHHLPYVYNSLKIKAGSKRLHMDSIRKILTL